MLFEYRSNRKDIWPAIISCCTQVRYLAARQAVPGRAVNSSSDADRAQVMKIIHSAGGPLIGLDRDHVPRWSGIAGKRFIGDQSPFPTDHEAVGDLTDGVNRPPVDIAKLQGIVGDGLLITVPFRTAIIRADRTSVYMAQVEYAEAGWSFSEISKADFDKAEFQTHEDIYFHTRSCIYLFFDSAYPGEMIEDDYLSFDIAEGNYALSFALYDPDPLTNLLLYRITRSS
jgi:hypothetical protein